MLFEDIILAVFVIGIVAMTSRPMYKLYRRFVPAKVDPVAEAKEHLEHVRQEAEVARLQKEAEHVIDEMYKEELEDEPIHKEHSR